MNHQMPKVTVSQTGSGKTNVFFRCYKAFSHISAVTGISLLTAVLIAAPSDARNAPESFADLAEKLLPAVVNISTTQVVEGRGGVEIPQLPPGSPFEDFFKEFFERNIPQERRSRKSTSLGSGFVIDPTGYIVTNNHVIQDADEITVSFNDNTRLKAEVVGRDAKTDLAVLKVKPEGKLTHVKFGNSETARVGDWIVAIGNPFGLGSTVTAGILSARGRNINAGPYDDFLQTDASINRGNSGGPMFNLDGGVIGINTAIFSPSGGSVGIGFAIPSAVAEPVIKQLIKHGKVDRGWLGVHIQGVTPEIAETLGLKESKGALVASVIKDGPAEKAKIKAGDVILKFGKREVDKMRNLPRIVAETPVGTTVNAEIWRDKKRIVLPVTVAKLEDQEEKMTSADEPKTSKGAKQVKALGLTLSAITPALRKKFNLTDKAKGVVILDVEKDSAGSEKGIRVGDLIDEVNQEEVSSPADVEAQIAKVLKAGKKVVLVRVEGQNGGRFLGLRIDNKKG
ncbi:MAG: DegQ family serine endoprotease [Rhodospirillales bacterium]